MAGSLLALSWWFFPDYQKPCHVLLLTQVVHFEVESTCTPTVSMVELPVSLPAVKTGPVGRRAQVAADD